MNKQWSGDKMDNSSNQKQPTYGGYSDKGGAYYSKDYYGSRDRRNYYDYGNKWGHYSKGFGGNGNRFGSFIRNKIFYQVIISLFIFAVGVAVYDSQDAVGKFVAGGFKKVLSTETNIQPLLAKIINFGLAEEDGLGTLVAGTTGTNEKKKPPADDGTEGVQEKPAVAEQPEISLALPVSGSVVKKYGWSTDKDDYPRFNSGIEIKAKAGKNVKAAADGKVIKIGKDKILGNYVRLSHKGQLVTLYGYLATVTVDEGDLVKEGDEIGTVGSTGVAEEPKLHFELVEEGKIIDPAEKLDLISEEGI